jgi:hypothetical protein
MGDISREERLTVPPRKLKQQKKNEKEAGENRGRKKKE